MRENIILPRYILQCIGKKRQRQNHVRIKIMKINQQVIQVNQQLAQVNQQVTQIN